MTLTETPVERPRRLPPGSGAAGPTRRSWAMVPIGLVIWLLVDTLLFSLLKGPLGIREGEVLLMARSVAGWFAEVGSLLVVLAAPVAGVVFGATALRRGGHGAAVAGLVVNAAGCLLALYMFIDDIHMTYSPGWW